MNKLTFLLATYLFAFSAHAGYYAGPSDSLIVNIASGNEGLLCLQEINEKPECYRDIVADPLYPDTHLLIRDVCDIAYTTKNPDQTTQVHKESIVVSYSGAGKQEWENWNKTYGKPNPIVKNVGRFFLAPLILLTDAVAKIQDNHVLGHGIKKIQEIPSCESSSVQ